MRNLFTRDNLKELKAALKNQAYAPYHRRLQAILLRSEGLSFQKISDLTGYVPQTVKNQVDKYFKDGLSAVVTETRGGRHRSYLTVEEEQAFFKKILDSSIDAGEMVTTTSLFEAYQEEIGQEVPRQTFYALLKRHGWRKVTPRPEHPQKADAQTIVASKNKIYIQDSRKALQTQPSL